MGVLETKILKILGLESSDFGQNMVENATFFKKLKQLAQERRIDGRLARERRLA